jgi:hypothetical protein
MITEWVAIEKTNVANGLAEELGTEDIKPS